MPETPLSTTHQYAPQDPAAPDLKAGLLRLALLPLGAAAAAGAGAVLFLLVADDGRPVWANAAVLGCAAVFVLLIAYLAVAAASRTETDLRRRVGAVRRSTVETHYKVWQVLDDLQRASPGAQRWSVPLPNPGTSATSVDEALALLTAEAGQLRAAAEAVAFRGVPAPAPAPNPPPPPKAIAAAAMAEEDGEPGVGIFVNRARRLQVLAHREIVELDFLERQVEDPDLLKGLFSVDHLATRVRRHAENLAVLGGGPSHRQWSRPVNVYEALRSSVAEVEHYARVKLVRPIDGTLQGHAVADFIHLVAELVENATLFSPPNTQVLIRVAQVRTGLAVEVEDRGLGMEQADRQFYNNLLAAPGKVDIEALLADGRIGLYVVAQLAKRHKFVVQLQGNIFGGTQAVVVVPTEVLGEGRSANEPREVEPPRAEPEPPPVQISRPRPTAGAGPNGTGPIEVGRHATGPIETGPVAVASREPRALPAAERPAEGRPALPKRSRQQHLAPQLRDPRPPAGTGSDAGHDPGLMSAFQQGRRRADVQDPPIPSSDSSVIPHQDEEA